MFAVDAALDASTDAGASHITPRCHDGTMLSWQDASSGCVAVVASSPAWHTARSNEVMQRERRSLLAVFVAVGCHGNHAHPPDAATDAMVDASALPCPGAIGFPSVPWPVAGPATHDAVIADLDGDGRRDLVALSDTSVAVLLGHGDGTFSPPMLFATGASDTGLLSIGDFNGDGKPDVVLADLLANAVIVLLGNGDGTLGAAQVTAVGGSIASLALADFDKDTHLDLSIANGAGSITVLLGQADGTFAVSSPVAAGGTASAVATADLDGDGAADLVIANGQTGISPGKVSVMMGNGNGTFQLPVDAPTNRRAVGLLLADLDHDGHVDVVVWGSASVPHSNVGVLRGGTGGSFGADADVAGGLSSVSALADINGDGNLDLVANEAIYNGHGDATFDATPTGHYPVGADAVGDLNDDGKIDIVGTAYESYVAVSLGFGDGTFLVAKPFGTNGVVNSTAAADFDGDGNVDVVAAIGPAPGNFQIDLLRGFGDGGFAPPIALPAPANPSAIVTTDFDHDGHADLAYVHQYPSFNTIGIWLGNGNGSFQPELTAPSNGSVLAVGDFDGDGVIDLATDAGVLLGHGDGTFTMGPPLAINGVAVAIATGDLDRDGHLDLVIAIHDDLGNPDGSFTSSMMVRLGNGDGTFRAGPTLVVGTRSRPAALAIADIDGDGASDVVATDPLGNGGTQTQASSTVVVFLGRGDGTFGAATAFPSGASGSMPVPPYLMNVIARDLDADGYVDLAVANLFGNTVSVLFGRGSGAFDPPQLFEGGGDGTLLAVDVDHDARLDLVGPGRVLLARCR